VGAHTSAVSMGVALEVVAVAAAAERAGVAVVDGGVRVSVILPRMRC
jgi:hypothetical protein